jgi:flagellin-specific chaperone FliS
MMQTRNTAAAYKERQILTASPIELLILNYDAALMSCQGRDMARALQAVGMLRSSLNWEAAPEIAPRLQAIYEYCEECIRREEYELPLKLLRDLRDTWVEVRRRMGTQVKSTLPVQPVSQAVSAFSVAG